MKILLATSGGIDSVVMCDLFSKAKINFAIAHCNFGLRGEESDEDEIFVKKLSLKYKVALFSTTFDTNNFAEKNKISIQMAARNLRYTWFEEIRKKHAFDFVATAHHQNDATETILLNLSKGTGIAGLHGILPKIRNIIRPILFANRELIFDYVVDNQLVWREDSSNDTIKYQRNYIRQEIVPKFVHLNPNFEETIQRTIQKVSDVEAFINDQFQNYKKHNLRTENGIDFINIEYLKNYPSHKILFTKQLYEYQFNYSQSIEILLSISKEAGKTFISPTHELVRDRNEFVVKPKNILDEFGTKEIVLDENMKVNLSVQNYILKFLVETIVPSNTLNKKKNTASLDFELLKGPLKIRKWKEGDWFCPLGMNKKKNISDFLNSEKVPLNIKNDICVITSNGSIVWIVGYRIDNRFKITEKTTKMLFIEQNY